ncbi:MAG: DUF3048 domain-containing protein [Candidatus Shapirobacteria bacterium]|jgi:hypothetical protein
MNQRLLKISIYVGILLVAGGLSHVLFRSFTSRPPSKPDPVSTSGTPTPSNKQTGVLTFSGPKTEACPLNGELFTADEKAIWAGRRPLAVMIENHLDSRPQSGLQNADVVYEAVAEGGITRFMALYYCNVVKGAANKYDVGPVRSARVYYLDLVSEYGDYPLYAHVGGANCSAPKNMETGELGPCTTNRKALAIEKIEELGWTQKGTWSDLNQFSLAYKACRREPERTGAVKDTEHTMYCSSSELWNIAANRGLSNLTEVKKTPWDKNFVSWKFNQPDKYSGSPTATKANFDFWSSDKRYSVSWVYDTVKNKYLRQNGGQPHIDFNNGDQLDAKNIVLQFTKESRSIDVHGHNLYEVIGKGKGVLIQNGTKTDIDWTKANRTARTIFKETATGKEVNFVPGRIWIEVLPLNATVNYEAV